MSIRPAALIATVAAVVLSAVPLAAEAAPATRLAATAIPRITEPYAPGELLVGFRPGTAARDRQMAREAGGAVSHEQLSPIATDVELWRLTAGRGVPEAIAAVSQNPNVRYAEPNYHVTRQATSNDPYFTNGSLWGMQGPNTSPKNSFGSNAAAAWAAGVTGSRNVYVAVIDEGMQYSHPDLAANTWVNPYEVAGNGKDDDGNGYIDDVRGWDFYNGDASTYDGTEDDHGTHVSGTIGGIGGNGSGVAGVNWAVMLISAKFLGPNGGYISDAVRATDYVTNLKTLHPALDIVATNNSWGGGGFSTTMQDAIRRGGAKNILFVAAAGNATSNNDTTPAYPASYTCKGGVSSYECVVAVASITSGGALSSFSNYGATSVDLGAPGSGVNSTVPVDLYASYSGTSMATPHVTGALALCASMSGQLRGANLRTALLSSTVPTASLSGKTVTGGRLDIGAMIGNCGTTSASVPTATTISPSSGPVGTAVTISGSNLTGATVTFGGTALATSNVTSTSVTVTVPAGAVSGPFTVTTPGGTSVTPTFTVTSNPSATVPAAPTNVLASSPAKSTAQVQWTLSASDGGSAITAQTVTVYSGGVIVGTVSVSATTTMTRIRLNRGQAYTFTVSATNAIGTSVQSLPSGSVTIL